MAENKDNNKNGKKLPYSYHTFLFPFIWNNGGKADLSEFKDVLQVEKRWRPADWGEQKIPDDQDLKDWLLDYAAYQYLTEPANNAIFNTADNGVVHCYEYYYNKNGEDIKLTADGENFKYIITKKKDNREIKYTLVINRIRLYVYNAGVAVMVLELENYDHKNLDAVNAINEYGRRINLPYIAPGESRSLCANQIELNFFGKEFAKEDYEKTFRISGEKDDDEKDEDFQKRFDELKGKISLNYVMEPIQKLLDGDGNTISTKTDKNGKFFIKPCVDDRMFVCCLVRDKALSNEIVGVGETDYSFLKDWDKADDETTFANRIYKFLYVDTSLTCQNRPMKKELLMKSVYRRWTDYGTLHGVTHNTFCCITSDVDAVEASVINPFLTQYVKFAILTLVQRSVMLSLFNEAAMVSDRFDSNKVVTEDSVKSIEALLAKYVKAQNQLLLSEITSQEQGIELYEMLCEHLYIEQRKKNLDEQMNNLRDVATSTNERLERNSDDTLNRNLAWLSLAGILLAIIQDIPFFINGEINNYQRIIGGILAVLLTGLGVALLRKTLFDKKEK